MASPTPRLRTRALLGLLGLGALLATPPVDAHRVTSVSLIAHLDTKKGVYFLDAAMEVIPSEDPSFNDQISPEDAAREFAGYLVVRFDEADQEPKLEIEVEEASDAETPPELRRQQILTRLSGAIPEGAKEFLLYLDPRCPMAVVMVVIKDELPSRRMQVILSGEYSRPVSVLPVEEGDPFALAGSDATTGSEATAAIAAQAGNGIPPGAARRALGAGFRAFLLESPLPGLLAASLLLLTLGRTSLLWQAGLVLASSGLVLALSVARILPALPWAAEATGLLVAILALESLFVHHLRWWRYPILALAGASLGGLLATLPSLRGLATAEDAGALAPLLAPLGAGAALLLAVLAAAAVLLPLSRFPWYRKSVVAPLAVLVAGCAAFLALERFL